MNFLSIEKFILLFLMGFVLFINGISFRNISFYIVIVLVFRISELRYSEGKHDAYHAVRETEDKNGSS